MTFVTSQCDGGYRIGDGTESPSKNGYQGDVPEILTIPSQINQNKIIEVGSYSFYNVQSVKIISIEEGIERIGICAFFKDKNLIHVFLPSSLKIIGNNAFDDTYSLENVHINQPSQLMEIGVAAFSTSKKLKQFIIPNSVNNIGVVAFDEIETNFIIYYCGTKSFPTLDIFGSKTSFKIIVPKNGVKTFAGHQTKQGITPCNIKAIGTCAIKCRITSITKYFLIVFLA